MTVHSTGPASIAVFVETDEMPALGVTGESLDERTARLLAEDAFTELGLPVGGRMEIFAFLGRGGLMMMASVDERELAFFAFEQSDALLDAIRLYDQKPIFTAYVEGQYYLVARADIHMLNQLGEHGRRLAHPPEFLIFLREHQLTNVYQ